MRPSRTTGADFRRFLQSSRRGEQLVVMAFALAVILLGTGAWAVWRAGEDHKLTADEALTDQASYLAGTIASHVQTDGVFAGRTILHAWDETLRDQRPWPTTDSIRRRIVGETIGPDMPDLAPTLFFAGDSTAWRTTEGPLANSDPVLQVVGRLRRDSIATAGFFRMVVVPHHGDTTVAFVMGVPVPTTGMEWYGFETSLPQFRASIILPRINAFAMSLRELRDSMPHPPPMIDREIPLAIAITTNDDVPLYRTRAYPRGPWIGWRWIVGGLASTVTLSIRSDAVPILIQSGYPVRHLAIILGIFVLGVLLLGLAAILVTRTLALSRQREEFTSSVSHELRTPLTNIQLFAETLLLDRARTPEERHSALETITRETRRLVHMVENVLALSRVGRPAETLVRRPERIDQLVRDVLYSFDPMLRSRDINVELQFDGSETAFVDGDAVRRILVNLLDNAVRYGPAGQTLRVTAVNRSGRLDLAVEDEGPGVPAADRDRVWEAFERGNTMSDSGTGIGLAVVRQLVRLHGGNARIEDGRRGARFVVALPTPEPATRGEI